MMERPSLHQDDILKRIAFQADTGLHSAVMNTIKWHQTTTKPIDQYRKTIPQRVLTSSTRRWLPSQIAPSTTTLTMLSP